MGYDVYGMNPQINVPKSPEVKDWIDIDWNKMTEDERESYFKAQDDYERENPGVYFRANVWYWRPIWDFVINVCDDFLSEKDIEAGFSNSGDKVSKTKALKIASRITKLEKDGSLNEWYEVRLKPYRKAQEHNKKIEMMMDGHKQIMIKKYGKDIPPRDYDPEDYGDWEEMYNMKDWNADYPPSKDAILDFRNFCKESGGFEIC